MKTIISFCIALFVVSLVYSQENNVQDQLSKGTLTMDFNTGLFGFGEGGLSYMQGSTAVYLTSIDDFTFYNVGFDAGYFVAEGVALKLGLGYGGIKESDGDGYSSFSYRLGLKYYITNIIPLQVDLTGAQIEESDENPMWLGLQAGYAFFVGSNVSIEPSLRYSLSLNEDFTDDNIFQFNIGLTLFL